MELGSVLADSPEAGARVIYVVDDDGDLRRSLHFMLKPAHIVVSSFASGPEFLTELSGLRPAPIILDIRMPEMDGTEVLSTLATRQIMWPVIVLTGHGEVGLAVRSMKLGACEFLLKPAAAQDLLSAIDAAYERLAGTIEYEACSLRAKKCFASLTCREREVIERLCRGRSNKQVAFDLSISVRTVEMHRANALHRLGVRSLVEAGILRTAATQQHTRAEAAQSRSRQVQEDAFKSAG